MEMTGPSGQFCDAQKVFGQGAYDIDISIRDNGIGLYYGSTLVGNGDFDVDESVRFMKLIDQVREAGP